ncbi:MAG: endonuclease MutS2 [Halanaerobium sp.]|nr:endonuclease MutS2 [Halanaerobium sp.]
MDKHTLHLLEYKKVKEQVKERATCYLGRFVLDKMEPSADRQFIEDRQKEVTAAREILIREDEPPFGGIRDIRSALKKAEKAIMLEPEELLDIRSTLYAARRMKGYFARLEDEDGQYQPVLVITSQLNGNQELEEEIGRCIGDTGEVLDSASPRLRQLRIEIKKSESRIRDKLDSIITDRRYGRLLQEGLVTIRENRFVVPVKSEAKNAFPGIVHDRSSSGQTVFIEPMAVVKLNNKLRELKSAEQDEIYKILKQLTYQVQAELDIIEHSLQILAYLDALFAKARYSIDFDCSEPVLNEKRRIKLLGARHPLLPGTEVVPIDIEVGGEFNSLVITGPNTGGKTVSLKTAGLLTAMAQSGLHIPAISGSEVGIFTNIYADIGDEQSIEQSLSTFSSHVTQIVKIVERVTGQELVILDELGAGTDPAEGAALAMSILEYLHEREVRTLATTHYSELKAFAYSRDGIENASVEFNIETLSPTYHLITGIPGRSNAFEIAGRLGLDDDIIASARARLQQEERHVDSMIRNIEEKQQDLNRLEKVVQEERERSEELKAKHQTELEALQNKKDKILQDAYRQAKDIIRKAKEQSKELVQQLKERSQANPDRLLHDINESVKGLEGEIEEGLRPDKQRPPAELSIEDLALGEWVHVHSLNQKGQIADIDKSKKEVRVKAGVMTLAVPVEELTRVEPEMAETGQKKSIARVKADKSSNISSSLDLRGMRYEEAKTLLDKYLDDAYLAGLERVEVIHGKGTGALRSGVQELLQNHYQVADFRLGTFREGGSGVTVVKLKK